MQLSTSRQTPSTSGEIRLQARTNLNSVSGILISVMLAGTGQLIFKAALNITGKLDLSLETFIKLATSPLIWVGLAVFGVSAMLWLVALMKAELSFAYPFLSLSYVIVLLGGAFLFHDQITPLRLAGFAIIIVGLLTIARGEQQTQS